MRPAHKKKKKEKTETNINKKRGGGKGKLHVKKTAKMQQAHRRKTSRENGSKRKDQAKRTISKTWKGYIGWGGVKKTNCC